MAVGVVAGGEVVGTVGILGSELVFCGPGTCAVAVAVALALADELGELLARSDGVGTGMAVVTMGSATLLGGEATTEGVVLTTSVLFAAFFVVLLGLPANTAAPPKPTPKPMTPAAISTRIHLVRIFSEPYRRRAPSLATSNWAVCALTPSALGSSEISTLGDWMARSGLGETTGGGAGDASSDSAWDGAGAPSSPSTRALSAW